MATRSTGSRWRRLAALSLACMAAGAQSACTTASRGAPSGETPGSTTADVTPSRGAETVLGPAAIVGELDVGGAGWGMAKAGGALWIQVDPPVDAIVRVDIATGAAVPMIPGGTDAKAGPEGLWVACCDGIARVDPATGRKELQLALDGAFALADGSVWTLGHNGLQEFDPESGSAIGDSIDTAIDPTQCEAWKDLIVAFGSAWLACKEGRVVRIEIPSGKQTTITTGAGAHTFALTDDAVWVTNYQAGSVSRIDPTSSQVTPINGAGSGVGITSGGGYVWAAAGNGIAKIDPVNISIVDVIDLGPGQYYELVWDDGIIWVSTRSSRVLKVDAG